MHQGNGQQAMFLMMNPLREGSGRVVGQNGDRRLGHDWARIQILSDEMDCASTDPHAGLQGLANPVQPTETR